MILSNHQINFNITQTCPAVHDFGSFGDRRTIGDDTPCILPITAFTASAAVFQVCIKLLEFLFPLSVSMFAFPDPVVQPFMAHRALSRFFSLLADQFRAPLFLLKHLNRIFLHSVIKLQQLGLVLMTSFRLLMSSFRLINTGFSSSSSRIPPQFSRNRRRMNADHLCYKLLLHSCLKKGFNLIPLYQTELGVIFCHRNAKIALLGQTAKSPKKLLCRLFLKIALIS